MHVGRAVEGAVGVVLVEQVVFPLPVHRAVGVAHEVGGGEVVVEWAVGIVYELVAAWIQDVTPSTPTRDCFSVRACCLCPVIAVQRVNGS